MLLSPSMTNPKVKAACEAIKSAIHSAVEKLPPDLYREVLEDIELEISSRTDALNEEEGEDKD